MQMKQLLLFPLPPREGQKLIFRPYRTTKSGKRVYPKNGRVFPMWVDK